MKANHLSSSSDMIVGNTYDKYNSQNPLARFLFRNFTRCVQTLVGPVPASQILEVGCGEGYLSELLCQWKPEAGVCGVDLSEKVFDARVRHLPRVHFSVQSAYQLAFPSRSFDLVVGVEVLEHLAAPQNALAEIGRLTRRYVLLSVPREPLWRLLNMARLAYLKDLGNTPGHIQHWSSSAFVRLVGQHFRVLRVLSPLPWTMVLAERR
jgi:2-polyprenyl-3-methyl-5-hydroxy-6-metoxy-1,4-benzoquinol methylase